MTIDELLANEALRQREFPAVSGKVFLAHAGVAPLPLRAVTAMTEYLRSAGRGDQESVFPTGLLLNTRRLAARLLACVPDEVALIGPTSLGLSLIANGLSFERGDNVVCYRDDYPANVYPWRALANRGVEVRSVEPSRTGQIDLDSVAHVVNARTRLVSLASAHFATGYRLDVPAIGKFLRERNILFCVDGIQTLGALRTTVEHVDFLAADSHKWLLGPSASGLLFVKKEHFNRLRPTLVGWNNIACPEFVAQDEIRMPDHAGRYECGSPNLVGIVGMHASLKLIDEIGIDVIERRVLALARRLVELLETKGYEVIGPQPGAAFTGIVSCRKPGLDMAKMYSSLMAKKIILSLRTMRDGAKVLRFSPHFYNTERESEEAVAALA